MGERRFCYRCMEKYDMDQHICPHCGYDSDSPYDPMYIIPGTVLKDRYLVGVLASRNGEGATYIGHDISTGCNVLLREYMPVNFCTRVKNKATINVNYNNLAKYKAFMAEYTELNKSLARLRNNSNINPILDMFAENNTTYTVFEYIEGKKMLNYLKDNAGELSWEQVSKLFPPLFTTIGILHNAGIIHRAISPETVYITSKNELILSGFCVSAVRTADAGLEHELFKGYAAPEQYSASSSCRQGTWTDVYGICALLYRALTGCMPVDSLSRLKNDDLCEPAMLNTSIPKHVSRAIMDGMNLSGADRIQTITELVTRLFEYQADEQEEEPIEASQPIPMPARPEHEPVQQPIQPQYYDNRANVPPPRYYDDRYDPRMDDDYDDYDDDDDDDYRYEKVNTVDRLKVPVIIGILLLAILLIISVFLMKVFVPQSDDESSSKRSSTSENVVTDGENSDGAAADTEVPNFLGKFISLTEDKYKEYFTFEVTYEYSNDREKDVILEQSVEAGTLVPQGTTIKLVVSKGKDGATIPSYEGLTVSQYENALKEAGITNYTMVVSSSSWGYPNTIVELQIDGKNAYPGEYFSNKDSNKLNVYYIPADAQIQPPATQQNTEPSTETPTHSAEPTTNAPTEPPAPTDPPPTDPPATEPPQTDTPPEPNSSPSDIYW